MAVSAHDATLISEDVGHHVYGRNFHRHRGVGGSIVTCSTPTLIDSLVAAAGEVLCLVGR